MVDPEFQDKDYRGFLLDPILKKLDEKKLLYLFDTSGSRRNISFTISVSGLYARHNTWEVGW